MASGGESSEGSSPSPIRDEGWMGPGGRKVVALGITLIVLILGGILIAGGTEEIGDFFDELAQKDEGANEQTTTLEDTTIEDATLPEPAVPEEPVDPVPAPEPKPEADPGAGGGPGSVRARPSASSSASPTPRTRRRWPSASSRRGSPLDHARALA